MINFFILLFIYILFIFKSAFSINFFQDDYFFLKISRANTLFDFLRFYSPFHEYSYKPLATESFYFLFHLFDYNTVLGHFIVFTTFFIGLVFLYKIVRRLLDSDLLAKLTVFLYATSFIHVFQLYWFATFQEICVFTFLSISFHSFLKKRFILSMAFFIMALLSKETALLFVPFLVLFVLVHNKDYFEKVKKYAIPLSGYIIIAFLFWLLFRYSLNYVTSLDNYKITFSPKLVINNAAWYWLWAIGFPNFMPDYFKNIISLPLPAFWKMVSSLQAKLYFSGLLVYMLSVATGTVFLIFKSKEIKKYALLLVYGVINFFIFLGPILFFRHKWMIRLTMPLIFISFIEAILIYLLFIHRIRLFKYTAVILLVLYAVWNYFGIRVHEETSTYLLENRIFNNTQKYFTENKSEILKHDSIYFQDKTFDLPKGWNGSEKLKLSLSGESFLDYYFPESKLKVIYGFENDTIPVNAYIIDSKILLK